MPQPHGIVKLKTHGHYSTLFNNYDIMRDFKPPPKIMIVIRILDPDRNPERNPHDLIDASLA